MANLEERDELPLAANTGRGARDPYTKFLGFISGIVLAANRVHETRLDHYKLGYLDERDRFMMIGSNHS